MTFNDIGLHVPTILLPDSRVNMTLWSVIACDQYTSQPDYWKQVKSLVGDSPSTLHLIFPEVYLNSQDEEAVKEAIHRAMKTYLDNNILVPQKPGFIALNRKTAHTASRKGLIVALDLEKYDYTRGSQSLIRATEETILERVYPRVRIRKKAALEVPHILVLIDDPERTVIEPLFCGPGKKAYDFDLMMNCGHVCGYTVEEKARIGRIADALALLADPAAFETKYGVSGKGVLLYAMGDGNHSFATVKMLWESLKKENPGLATAQEHPARYALVELVNLHDEGLVFEPIHRVVFNCAEDNLLEALRSYFAAQGSCVTVRSFDSGRQLQDEYRKLAQSSAGRKGKLYIRFLTSQKNGIIIIEKSLSDLEVEALQAFLDGYLKNNPQSSIDYIHGEDATAALASQPGTMGFLLPAFSKHTIFKTIITRGVFPRKAFSLGEADEKRFYLEARKIVL